jgi:hypothetical protein
LVHLEVGPERPDRDVRGQHYERRAGLGGLRQPRERVSEAGALMDASYADLPAGAGVAVRHSHRAGLVPGGIERGTRRVERVQNGEVAASGEPEARLDPAVYYYTSDRL